MRLPSHYLLLSLALFAAGSLDANDDLDFFERKIRPVLVERCYGCHSAESQKEKGGLRLDSRDSMMRGGDSGPAIVPNKTSDSLLLAAIRYESLEMPPDGRLSDEVIKDFERWIERGAIDPRIEMEKARESIVSEIDYEAGKQFWAFQRPTRHPLPEVSQTQWVKRPLDAFVVDELERIGLKPSPSAEPRVLIRRLSYDLTGLPPSLAMAEAFAAQPSAEHFEAIVDRLLDSPQYGERWARLWLDLARYAEDQAHIVGGNRELCYPNAYRYRDWVVQALNRDIAYDEFLRKQLAADLIEDSTDEELVALGFIGLGPKYYRRNSPEVMADEWEERIDIVSRGLLGMTVACARCHDHKFDPIGTEDYYGLAGVFASTEMFNRPLSDDVELGKKGEAKSENDALHVVRETQPKDLAVMIRGDVNRLGPTVPRRFLRVLCETEPTPFPSGSGRRELAYAIANTENPLTARVMVNRIWGELIGNHLVATPSNFGTKGERPTHPELLDDLSVRWMENGWSLKWLIREIVLSSTYQQSSDLREETIAVDPTNQWLSRMNRKRLSVEAWRDTVLMVTGQLDGSIGGKSIDPSDPLETRRTLYSEVSRLSLNRMLATFDFPDPNAHSDRRARTVSPLQKLFVLNSPFMVKGAEHLAKHVLDLEGDMVSRVRFAYLEVFGRPPSEDELRLSIDFLSSANERWTQWSQALLATNELAFLD